MLGGYYIAPSGEVIEVEKSHIAEVLENPEKFLLTKKELQDTYKKYNEPIGLEGKAREEIMSNLIRQGWVRVRFTPKKDAFVMQVNRMDNKKKEQIASFAKHAIEGIHGKKFHKNVDVNILDLNANLLESFNLGKLADDVLYTVSKVITIAEYRPSYTTRIKALFIGRKFTS